MKTITILVLTAIISFKSFAQSTIIQPEVFQLHLSTAACPSADYTGSIFYNSNSNLFNYCVGINNFRAGGGHWIGTTSIYRNSIVGIRKGIPLYDLDINGNNRATDFYVGGNIGIGTSTPIHKIELVDREFAISSTADASIWKHRYLADRFDIVEGGLQRLQIYNGGNMGIGGYSFTPKLYVNGAVNFDGNLRESGFGTMASTETTVQQMATATMTVSSLSIPANSCATWGFSKPSSALFTNPPAGFIGNKISGSSADEHILLTVENMTTSGGTVRFCNNLSSARTLSSIVYSIVMIGE